MLLSRIGLPTLITAPIQEFFEKPTSRRSQSVLARTLRIANIYAHGLMLAASADKTLAPLGAAECGALLGNELPVLDDVEIRSQVMMTTAVLAGASTSDAGKAFEPLIPASKLRVCYVRHESYSSLDPLHSLLRLTSSHVEVLSRLPGSAGELEGIDALLIAPPSSIKPGEIRQDLERISQLVAARPVATLYLDPTFEAPLAQIPPCVTVEPLPLSLHRIATFLTPSATTHNRAA